MIIAIDGPAASGKGTLARNLARHFGLPHLDTGLLYRATARALMDAAHNLADKDAAVAAARGLTLTTGFDEISLRGREMAEAASIVAAIPEVRTALAHIQRVFAHRPGGAVLDGRDIGTVICPEARPKIFVTASAEARATRRALELRSQGDKADYAAVLADIVRRDERDKNRAAAPLMAAKDAIVLDTTTLDADAAFKAALAIVMALVEIKNEKELKAWLRKQPREVAVAFAARAALRVLPHLQTTKPDERYMRDIILASFRAMAVSWAAARYPTRETEVAARAATAAFVAVGPTDATARAANAAAQAVRAAAVPDAFTAATRAAAYTADAFTAAIMVAKGIGASSYATTYDALAAADVALWSAVSLDATRVEEGAVGFAITSSPLWPQGQPEQLQSLWHEMIAALLAEKQDWQVWTTWYEDRLKGRARDEARELVYVRIEEALWDQGPAIVNAEIKRLIEELEPPPPIAGATAQHLSQIVAAWQSADAALQIPHPRRQHVPDVLFNPVALADTPPAPVTPELRPPEARLPPPSPATRFVVQLGIVDVVPPTAWASREAQVAIYQARARTIALSFSDKLANTDAEPELTASVHVVVDVLGDDPSQLQPDQLRLASRTITSKARAYGHPSARGELSVESVSILFELADVLVSLQALASQELEEHERAIRMLDLTEASLAEAKEGLDLVAEAIAVAPEIVSELASVPFEAGVTASDNAADKTVQITIEGDRILLTENLALALAQELAKSVAKAEGGREASPSANEIVQKGQRKKSKTRGQLKTTRRRANREVPNEQSWEDLKGRYIARLEAKAPEALADATLDAATSTIKHLPKTIPVLAGLVYAAIVGAPALLAAGGGLSVSLAWIGYELWKTKKPPV